MRKFKLKAKKRYAPTDDDLQEDVKEAYGEIMTVLIGALIEPGRNPEQFTRRWIREALAADKFKRLSTRQMFRNAQREESAFEWCREHWQLFADARAKEHETADVVIDFDTPVKANV